MGKKPTSDEPMANDSAGVEHARFQDAFELLSDRQYEQVEQLLIKHRESAKRNGHVVMEIILAAACQLCLTCRQFQADRTQYQQSLKETKRRERESRMQIRAILSLLSQLTSLEMQILKSPDNLPTLSPEALIPDERDSEKQPNFIQKVKQLLGLEPPPPEDEAEVDTDSEIEPFADSSGQGLFIQEKDLISAEAGQAHKPDHKRDDIQAETSGARAEKVETVPEEDGADIAPGDEKLPKGESSSPMLMPPVEPLLLLPPPKSPLLPAEERPSTPIEVSETELPENLSPEGPSIEFSQPPPTDSEEDELKPSVLVVYCLGPFRVYQNNELITEWSGFMGQKILKYIITQRGKPVPKEVLMTMMWVDVEQEAARRNLHQAIYSLRQTLRRREPNLQHILFENDCYLLNPATGLWIDFLEFEKNVQKGQRLEAEGQSEKAFEAYGVAEGLYQGTFLEEDIYEEWSNIQRDHLLNLYLEAGSLLSEYFWNRRNIVSAIALCQKILRFEPCFEAAHRQLILCYLAQGQRHLAMRQYQTCVQFLKEELDLNPSEETEALRQQITT